ncbi:MAG TPA: ABC transporter substrate-binding protein [Chloroflexota bacterium]|nr:ABC transporter substrate-binding protein [Chloroflexota bacterium]
MCAPAALAALAGNAVAGDVVPAPGGAYVEAAVGAPRHLNPLLAEPGSPDDDLCALLYAGLTRVEPDGEVRPDLALAWQLSPDGKRYTFRLRPDARWHDGRPVTGDDVAQTVRLLQAPDFAGDPALAGLWRGITVEAASGEVRFTLPRPNAWFPEQASLGVLPAHVVGGASGRALLEHGLNARPLGSGPFKLVTADPRRVELAAFDGYHGRRPYLQTVEMRFYGSVAAAAEALRRGEVNALRPLPLGELPAAPNGVQPFALPELGRRLVLVLNTRSAPFDEPATRAKVVRALSGGAGGHDLSGLRLTIVTNDRPEHVRLAEELARRLARVGAAADVQAVGWSGMIADVLAPGRFQAALVEHRDGLSSGDPGPFWSSAGRLNFGRWASERADALLVRAYEATSPEARRGALREWDAVFETEAPGLVVEHPRLGYWVGDEIRGVRVAQLASPRDRFAGLAEWHVFTRRAAGRF